MAYSQTFGRSLMVLVVGIAAAHCNSSDNHGPPEDSRPSTPPVFTFDITDMSRIIGIVPPGSIAGDELKGHSYIRSDGSSVPVYAPVEMTLVSGTWVGKSNDYGLQLEINKRFVMRLGHLTDLRADLRALIPRTDPSSRFDDIGPVLIRAGEQIGTAAGTAQVNNSFDVGLYDLEVDLPLPNAARYKATYDWTKLNSVCPYTYFTESLRARYFEKFASIGGEAVPGAPCRTLVDVAGTSGGVAGEWFLDGGSPSDEYPTRLAIGRDLAGRAVRVGRLASFIDVVGADDPRTIASSVCYEGNGQYFFIRLRSPLSADVSAAAGPCPATFPATGTRAYAR